MIAVTAFCVILNGILILLYTPELSKSCTVNVSAICQGRCLDPPAPSPFLLSCTRGLWSNPCFQKFQIVPQLQEASTRQSYEQIVYTVYTEQQSKISNRMNLYLFFLRSRLEGHSVQTNIVYPKTSVGIPYTVQWRAKFSTHLVFLNLFSSILFLFLLFSIFLLSNFLSFSDNLHRYQFNCETNNCKKSRRTKLMHTIVTFHLR